jgi:prevent-host-death family protein
MSKVELTYAAFRENLAAYLRKDSHDREVILVRRRGRPAVVVIGMDELSEMM